MLNEVFDQIHVKSKVAMKELQPAQSQCVGFPSPYVGDCSLVMTAAQMVMGPHGTTTATSTCGL